jgi:hypothetical protein
MVLHGQIAPARNSGDIVGQAPAWRRHAAMGIARVGADDFDDGRVRPATETLCAGIIESFELSFKMATHMIVPARKCEVPKLWFSDG